MHRATYYDKTDLVGENEEVRERIEYGSEEKVEAHM